MKPIKDYENYCIDIDGNIFNIITNKYLQGSIGEHGYRYYRLTKNGKKKMFYAHRLVAETYLDNPNKLPIVNHKDGNKLNNNLNNLEKISYQENNLHAEYIIKTHNSAKAVYQLDLDKKIIKTFQSISSAKKETGINNISRAIKLGTKAGGYYWKFKNCN